jgi:IclR family pca regulon transcriptional regulator
MKPARSDTPYHIESLARGLDVLALFSREQPTVLLTDVVKRTGLNKATAYRILSTLEATGYLERDPDTRRYRPGLKVLQLGFAALHSLDIRQIAHPHLEQLAHEQDLTGSLGVLDGVQVVYVDRIRNREIVGLLLGPGDRIPAHCSSMGKVMLAHLTHTELKKTLETAELKPRTVNSITSVEDLITEIGRIRNDGYALNDEELASGLRAVAAPIFDSDGHCCAAINVSGSSDMISRERLRHELPERVINTAKQISHALG